MKNFLGRSKLLLNHPNVSLFFWFFDVMNITLTITFLVVPYWFYNAGLVMGIIMLTICFIFLIVASLWTLEVLGRANVLYRYAEGYINLNEGYENIEVDINPDRKFEINEISSLSVGKIPNYIFTLVYIAVNMIFQFSALVTASQTLTTTIPINTTIFRTCSSSEFDTGWAPTGRCLNWYRIMVATFALFATALHFLRKKNQKYFMAFICLFRIFVILYMSCFSIFIITENNTRNQTKFETEFAERFSFQSGILAFASFAGIIMLPIMVPMTSYHVMNKKLLRPVMVASLIFSLIILTTFGMCLAFAFQSDIHPNSVLNLQPYTMDNQVYFIKIMSHLMIIFPLFDALPAYIFTAEIISNLTFTLLTGKDYTVYSSLWYWKMVNYLINLTYCVIPIIVCLFISNLVFFTVLTGIFISLCNVTFMGLIQYFTNRKCRIFLEPMDKSKMKQFWDFLFKTSFPTPNTTFSSNNMIVFSILFISMILLILSAYFVIVIYI